VVNNTSFDWRIRRNLRWQASLSISTTTASGVTFKDPRHTDYIDKDYTQQGEYTANNSRSWRYNANTTLTYSHSFKDAHNLSLTGRGAVQSTSNYNNSFSATGFPKGVPGIPSYAYSYKENTRPGYYEGIDRNVSFILALNYNYRYKYLFDFNYNSDGSTVFGRNQKFQSFWSVGAGWNISREGFAKNWEWLQELKLRGSYGKNGNQNVNTLSTNVYSYFSGNDIFGAASYLSGYANPNLKWQVVSKSSMGIDASTLQNRLNVSFDIYKTNTDPMAINIDQKPSSGVSSYPINLGYMNTKGLEFSISYHLIRNTAKQLMLNVRLTGNSYRSTYGGFNDALANLNKAYQSESGNASMNVNSMKRYRDGESPTALWAVRSLGIDPATGEEVFLTKDGVPTLKYNADDRVKIADRTPTIQGIFGFSFRYKKLIANFNFRYSLGGYDFNNAIFSKVENITADNIVYNQDRRSLYDRWQKPGDVAQFKGISLTTNTPISSRFIQRDNYIRGESAKISWDFSKDRWIKSLYLQDLRVNLSYSDLFTISTMKQERGIDYPFQRAVSIGLSARF
jgi:hypothetical protein